jgi:hypothetical protein
VSRAGWRGLVVGPVAITVAVLAFYWVLTFSPRQVTTTVTVLAPPLDSARSRVLVAAYSFKYRWVAEALKGPIEKVWRSRWFWTRRKPAQECPNTGSFFNEPS